MSKKYNELMGKIKVTEELRRRVMENVRNADIDSKPKIIRFPNLRRFGAIAACLALVLAGVLVVPNLFNPAESNPPVEMGNGIVECESAEALSKAVNFPILDLKTLPFDVTKTDYRSYWGEVAEIAYTGADGQSAVYRKSPGSDDNSGDYNVYDSTEKITVNTLTVELKGSSEGYTLACWTDGTYAYSLSLSSGIDAAEWNTIIGGID